MHNFIDVTRDDYIKLITDTEVRQNNSNTRTSDSTVYKRNEINLSIEGNIKKVYLGNRKIFDTLGSSDLRNESNKKIAKVLASQTVTLTLDGEAGTAALEEDSPIQDRFTLILKIKKSTN